MFNLDLSDISSKKNNLFVKNKHLYLTEIKTLQKNKERVPLSIIAWIEMKRQKLSNTCYIGDILGFLCKGLTN